MNEIATTGGLVEGDARKLIDLLDLEVKTAERSARATRSSPRPSR